MPSGAPPEEGPTTTLAEYIPPRHSAMQICAKCRRELGPGRFEVAETDPRGRFRGAVRVCSLRCLVLWSQAYAVMRGVQGVNVVKSAVRQVADLFRPPSGG